MSIVARRVLLAALVAWLAAPTGPLQAQQTPEQRRKALLEGTHVFRRILYDHNFKALDDFDELNREPQNTLLIVLGDLDQLSRIEGGLEPFVLRGGAVLLASDRPVRSRHARADLRQVAGVSINAETVVGHPFLGCYRGLDYCPLLVREDNARPDLLTLPPGPMGSVGVATNIPSFLRRRGPLPGAVRELATLPHGCRLDLGKGKFQDLGYRPLFLVGGEVGKGRVLVLADHSIFINEMMLPTDNQNVEFTVACVQWLRGHDSDRDRQRKRVLFVEEGRIQTELAIPLKSAVIPPEEALQMLLAHRNELAALAERQVVHFDNSDLFNESVSGFLDRIGWPLSRIVLVFGTLAVVGYGAFRLLLFVLRRLDLLTTPTSEAPLLAGAVGRTLPAAPLVDQRAYLLTRLGNLNEPAGGLAARWFARQGLPVPPDGPGVPPVVVQGNWWQRRQRLRQLTRLWRLAQGRSTERLGPAGLWRLQRELDALEAERCRGAWQPA